jgi:hypothetical protein
MRNLVKLEHYYFPWELEQAISKFAEHYNNHRYHESLNNVTPADVFDGRQRETLSARDMVKHKTGAERWRPNQRNPSMLTSAFLIQV